ncbi:MAG: Amuc_1100 family pilus-like protein [Verrucomicrobiales bacterium]
MGAPCGAAGFYFFNSLSAYQEQVDGFQSNTGSIETLLKKETQPNEKNLDSLKTAVEGYEENVKALFDSLQKYSKAFGSLHSGFSISQLLLEVVKSFQGYAKEKGLVIDKPESFFMGMGSYQTTIPSPKMVLCWTFS